MPKIEKLYAFVMTDKTDDDEGIPAWRGKDGNWMPLVGADTSRIRDLTPLAQQIADREKKSIKILEFSVREQVGLVTPKE
jgi:hypothetical protein